MKHLELHIIQSLPVNCVNRDDLNSPKTTLFGGVQRARVSSQCWKKAIRTYAKEIDHSHLFQGIRSRRFIHQLFDKLVELEIEETLAKNIAIKSADIIETLDKKKEDPDAFSKVKTMLFLSDNEYKSLAEEIKDSFFSNGDVSQSEIEKQLKKVVSKGVKKAHLNDAADIALFGRMIANDGSLQIEAASMFSHAISIHKVDNEIDFFTAIDDLSGTDDPGAGMTGTLEFNTATYYRFAALNLGMLFDDNHLKDLDTEQRKRVVSTFIESTLYAMPEAKKNSMNAFTLPSYVLGVYRENGHPIQLINAFEKPVESKHGFLDNAVELLKDHFTLIKNTWQIEDTLHLSIPDISKSKFIEGFLNYVN